jgi:hypothetical protein
MGLLGGNPIKYYIAMAPQGVRYEISAEALTHKRGNKPQPFKHIEANHADIRYYEHDNARKGLVRPNYTLDELWQLGRMGARV